MKQSDTEFLSYTTLKSQLKKKWSFNFLCYLKQVLTVSGKLGF